MGLRQTLGIWKVNKSTQPWLTVRQTLRSFSSNFGLSGVICPSTTYEPSKLRSTEYLHQPAEHLTTTNKMTTNSRMVKFEVCPKSNYKALKNFVGKHITFDINFYETPAVGSSVTPTTI